MICILRIIQYNSLVSNSSIIKFSCRFSARLHPGQAQDPPVLLLSPGTTMNLVLIFSRPQRYIINSSVISCTVTPGSRTRECDCLHFIFSGLLPYFSSSNLLPKLQYLFILFITIHVFASFIFEYFNCKKSLDAQDYLLK